MAASESCANAGPASNASTNKTFISKLPLCTYYAARAICCADLQGCTSRDPSAGRRLAEQCRGFLVAGIRDAPAAALCGRGFPIGRGASRKQFVEFQQAPYPEIV